MSAVVLEFVRPKKAAVHLEAPHYFCQQCNSDKFKAFESGAIRCVGCGVLMNNIFVSVKPEPA